MHILIVSSWYPYNQQDVTGTFVREQAAALAKTGNHRVGVLFPYFTVSGTGSEDQSKCCRVTTAIENGIATFRMSIPRFLNRIPFISAKSWEMSGNRLFKSYVMEYGHPDVIYAHTMFYAGVFAAQVNKRYAVPYVIIEHDSGYARGFVKGWQIALGKKAACSAQANLAVGKRFIGLLESVYGMAAGSWRCLPNMVADEFFHVPLPKSAPQEQFVYCTVCNLNSNKGIDILIRAFAKVFNLQPDSKLTIGGDGGEKTTLQRLTVELGVDQVVEFRGRVSRQEVINLICDSHVFVSSSYYETFGIAIAEANALGRPVIATKSGGPEDIVTPDNGLLTAVGDADEMAAVMMQVRDMYDSYIPAEIRNSCKARFSESAFINNIEKILQVN